ncbi:MAG: hypothetical protein FH748_14085 [Balneolaceae bacterium]|nr:hypothetical protein [Balneolaceae bacterium]
MTALQHQNSAFKTPLTDILGSKGHILVLRQMVKLNSSTSTSELLNRTGLSRQGAYNVVSRLLKTGILTYVGSGKKQQIKFNTDHPLTQQVRELFRAEKDRYDKFIKELKQKIQDLEPQPKSAWIFGKIAKGTDEYGDPVRIALLGDVKSVDQMVDRFRNNLYKSSIEKKYDVTIEVRGITLADRAVMNTHPVILLFGPDPQFYLVSSKDKRFSNKSHSSFDSRSLVDSEAWTEFLKMHPEVIQRTISWIEEYIHENPSGAGKELEEWKRILESMTFQRLKKFLESDSERSTRLRQSMPFWPVLTEEEGEELEAIKSQKSQAK